MESSIQTALSKSIQLEEILLKEFDCLKSKDLTEFEFIQNEKVRLLDDLSKITTNKDAENDKTHHDDPIWNKFLDKMDECRELHKRNQIFVNRKLDAIKGALQTLSEGSTSSIEIYDRLGRVSRKGGGKKKGYDEV